MAGDILTTKKVPEYIKEIVQRLTPFLIDYKSEEGDFWGYTFRLDAKWKCGYESQLASDCQKLIAWCRRQNAHAELIEYCYWYDKAPAYGAIKGSMAHLRKARKQGFRNHAYLVITDPVAFRFEKDNYYRD